MRTCPCCGKEYGCKNCEACHECMELLFPFPE